MEFEIYSEKMDEIHPSKIDQVSLISDLLSRMESIGLEPEIIFSALEAIKENPNLEPYEAMSIGFSEWVK
jgi:hypothetical protein